MPQTSRASSAKPTDAAPSASASTDGVATVNAAAKLLAIAGRPRADAAKLAADKTQCDGGDARACRALGIRYANGDGVDRAPALALELLDKACTLKPAIGCEPLGEMRRFGRAGSVDESATSALFKKACDAGDGIGCANLGELYATGRGVAKDQARAVKLYEQACKLKANIGCMDLANALVEGSGVTKDEPRSSNPRLLTSNSSWSCVVSTRSALATKIFRRRSSTSY